MKKEINLSKIFCDCCGKELQRPEYYVNDGSFQENFLTFGFGEEEIDLCFTCSVQVLQKLKPDLDKLKEIIEDIKPRNKGSLMFATLDMVPDSKFSWNEND